MCELLDWTEAIHGLGFFTSRPPMMKLPEQAVTRMSGITEAKMVQWADFNDFHK